ncbi:hypothetical protein Lmor_1377 [Legionella moravica]|uniref:Uncharacterized protein n=1 Tax=Legionella moravica TaxID=39962 RepID=A0A378K7W1_9GAMM|nr:hypothetical protein [Legionella moravica]KTD34844.1 hypothetical protein Lmor_1377 [Legionella moravica]STX63911.1 Uncharacterised protein [Legionella moravica]
MAKLFKFRDLKTATEFAEFSKGYMDSFQGKRLDPIQAIKTESLFSYKRIIGVYEGTQLVAGYIINQYPHRCFEYFTAEEQLNIIEALGGKQKVCEIVALWKSKSISRVMFNLNIGSHIIFDALKENRPIIFGCSYAGHGMIKRYTLLSPKLVRKGIHDNDLTVFYFRRRQMIMTYLLTLTITIAQAIYRKLFRVKKSAQVIIND